MSSLRRDGSVRRKRQQPNLPPSSSTPAAFKRNSSASTTPAAPKATSYGWGNNTEDGKENEQRTIYNMSYPNSHIQPTPNTLEKCVRAMNVCASVLVRSQNKLTAASDELAQWIKILQFKQTHQFIRQEYVDAAAERMAQDVKPKMTQILNDCRQYLDVFASERAELAISLENAKLEAAHRPVKAVTSTEFNNTTVSKDTDEHEPGNEHGKVNSVAGTVDSINETGGSDSQRKRYEELLLMREQVNRDLAKLDRQLSQKEDELGTVLESFVIQDEDDDDVNTHSSASSSTQSQRDTKAQKRRQSLRQSLMGAPHITEETVSARQSHLDSVEKEFQRVQQSIEDKRHLLASRQEMNTSNSVPDSDKTRKQILRYQQQIALLRQQQEKQHSNSALDHSIGDDDDVDAESIKDQLRIEMEQELDRLAIIREKTSEAFEEFHTDVLGPQIETYQNVLKLLLPGVPEATIMARVMQLVLTSQQDEEDVEESTVLSLIRDTPLSKIFKAFPAEQHGRVETALEKLVALGQLEAVENSLKNIVLRIPAWISH